jgi:hypothetical protein
MTKNIEKLNKLDELPYFSISQFNLYFKDRNAARVSISRWLKQNKLYSIKK